MQRKEINIFSTSFLDLLSGALGAVLILFIIIPKLTSDQQDAIEELERLNVETEQLADLIEQARNSIPAELYEQMQAQLEQMQNTIDELTQTVQNLQQRLQTAEAENERLREQLAQAQQQLQEAQRQLQEARRQLEQAQAQQAQQSQQAPRRDAAGERIFGMNAELGIVCLWHENIDVDLYVKNLSTGEVCYYRDRSKSFGSLLEDITSRTGSDDDRYELFFQQRIVPGRYLVYVNIYKNASLARASSATVSGYIVMFPGKSNEQKINYRQIRLTTRGENVQVGTLTVTENNINLEQ